MTSSIFSTVDVVTFCLMRNELHVLLHERPHGPFAGSWALPGVEVRPDVDDSVDAAAARAIKQKGGVTPAYLEQLCVFSGRYRDPRGWSQSCAFLALIHEDEEIQNTKAQRWVAVTTLNKSVMPFDHFDIIQAALKRLQSKTAYSTVAAYLAPKVFTLPQLKKVFDVCKGSAFDKVTFRRRMESSSVIEKLDGQFDHSTNRPAQLYSIKKTSNKVDSSLESGCFAVEFFDREI